MCLGAADFSMLLILLFAATAAAAAAAAAANDCAVLVHVSINKYPERSLVLFSIYIIYQLSAREGFENQQKRQKAKASRRSASSLLGQHQYSLVPY
jgi:glycosylphosphatidylinositol transamidase (GPIT) subunit GPI8